jgi:hypothetical protein
VLDEPPDPDDGFESDDDEDAAGFDSLEAAGLDSLEELAESPLAFFAAGLWYRSLYQPSPFSRKFPPEIRRFALGAPHFGQTLIGSSAMRCSCSHPALQASQVYS